MTLDEGWMMEWEGEMEGRSNGMGKIVGIGGKEGIKVDVHIHLISTQEIMST